MRSLTRSKLIIAVTYPFVQCNRPTAEELCSPANDMSSSDFTKACSLSSSRCFRFLCCLQGTLCLVLTVQRSGIAYFLLSLHQWLPPNPCATHTMNSLFLDQELCKLCRKDFPNFSTGSALPVLLSISQPSC